MSTVTCPDCSNVNPVDSDRCLACGYKLDFDPAAVPVQVEPPAAPPTPAATFKTPAWARLLGIFGNPVIGCLVVVIVGVIFVWVTTAWNSISDRYGPKHYATVNLGRDDTWKLGDYGPAAKSSVDVDYYFDLGYTDPDAVLRAQSQGDVLLIPDGTRVQVVGEAGDDYGDEDVLIFVSGERWHFPRGWLEFESK